VQVPNKQKLHVVPIKSYLIPNYQHCLYEQNLYLVFLITVL
jgi:hypothetical protein